MRLIRDGLRRVRDAVVLTLVVAHGWHFLVAGLRYWTARHAPAG